MNERIRIGAQLANVAFNWSQNPGRTLSVNDCMLLKNLCNEWDAARKQERDNAPQVAQGDERAAESGLLLWKYDRSGEYVLAPRDANIPGATFVGDRAALSRQPSADDANIALDAARYRWLREGGNPMILLQSARWTNPAGMDAAIDAALAAKDKP